MSQVVTYRYVMISNNTVLHKLSATALLVRYGCAGAIATAVHYLLFIGLLSQLTPLSASMIGAGAGAATSFLCNRQWTFIQGHKQVLHAHRFFVVAGTHNIFNFFMMKVLLTLLPDHPLMTQLIVSGLLFFGSFLLHRFWSYAYE